MGRNKWKHSRLFFGKNKVMALALGNSPQTEIMEGLHKLSKNLVNDVGVLFTNKPRLRKLNMPVALKKGIVTMLRDYQVCKEGDKLSAEQAKILKLLGVVMSQFSIEILYMYDKTTKEFEPFEPTPREKVFNRIHITADDQQYDYVEKNEGTTMET